MTCPICFDDMDMRDYNDEHDSTTTCYKLECGHAFHTKCIVQVLTRTDHTCPACNKHKSPEQKLELEGILRNLLREVKKDDRVRSAIHEYKESHAEYKAALKKLNAESRAWIRNRASELKIPEHKTYYQRATTAVTTAAIEVAREKGAKFVAAIKSEKRTEQQNRYGLSVVKQVLFGLNYPGYRDWRMRNPRVWVRI